MRTFHRIGLTLATCVSLAALSIPGARAGVTCSDFPDWCPPGIQRVQPTPGPGTGQSTPEPGALGLLALGSAVGILRMRRKGK